jgi:thioredoxin 1
MAVAAIVIAKRRSAPPSDAVTAAPAAGSMPWAGAGRGLAPAGPGTAPAAQTAAAPLPRLVDLGSTTCIPCRQMAPILADLKTTYAGQLVVEVIDVRADPAAGKAYGVEMIPTQIFFDASGKELSRHVGFMPKEDILARFMAHGIGLAAGR